MVGVEIAVFALATCVTPGPVNLVATVSGAQQGLRANLPFVLGATLGLSVVILVSGLGVSQVLKTNALLSNAVTLAGSGYILFFAISMIRKNLEFNAADGAEQKTSFFQGAALQLINPKAWLVSMSGLAMYLKAGEPSLLLVYALIFFVACFVSVFLWVCLSHMVAARLREAHLLIFTRMMGGLLLALVLYNLVVTIAPA